MLRLLSNERIEKIAFILLNILVADLCIFGAGRLIEFGPLTFRMILLLLLFAVCIPLFFKNFKSMLKSNYVRAILIFAIIVVFSTIIGIFNENRTNLIITDIKGFIYFAFLPCVIVLINSYEKIITVAKTSMYSAAVQALIHMIFIILYIADVPWLESLSQFCDVRRFFYVSYKISSVNVRVSFLSSICLLLGVAFSIYFGIKSSSKSSKIIYPSITAFCSFSLFMSYTRSAYLAVFVTVFILLIIFILQITKTQRISLLRHFSVAVIIFGIVVAGFNIKTGENYFSYGLSRMLVGIDFFDKLFVDENSDFDSDKTESNIDLNETENIDSFHKNTVVSDNLRATTVNDLIANIKKSPIIGLGLGAEIPSRPSGLNEYFFLDLFSKMGIIGLICYLSPFIFMIIQLITLFRKKHKGFLLLSTWFCILPGLITYSYFTPCMNSSVGILTYCCVMAVFEFYKKTKIVLED